MNRRLIWLTVYAVAMAYLESAVVVYLRAIYYPEGFGFPLVPIEPGMAAIEVGRELATLIMLLGVAMVMSDNRWELFLVFSLSFGVWDIFYYVWLWGFLGWPPSLLTWARSPPCSQGTRWTCMRTILPSGNSTAEPCISPRP